MSTKHWKHALALIVAGSLLIGCSDDDDDSDDAANNDTPTEQAPALRAQDFREFYVVKEDPVEPGDPDDLEFEALEGATVEADQWYGVLNGAGFRVEVPEQWNGRLVMYTHGYRGEIPELTVDNPPIRQWLIENGYAWAASSYSANYYDVRAGIESTNALALAFNEIAQRNGRPLDMPSKIYIMGFSMGGHVAAAAVEAETYATANNVVMYDGSVPMCGVVGGEKLFDYLLSFTLAAQEIAFDPGATQYPATNFDLAAITAELWENPPPTFGEAAPPEGITAEEAAVPNAKGERLQQLVENISGGERPVFEAGFQGPYYYVVMGTGGGAGTVTGILNKSLPSNIGVEYQFNNNPELSSEERAFNNAILRVAADPGVNPLRPDGLRWIPRVNGEFSVPVVTLHGLGDLYVPFGQEQIYRRRAIANGSDEWLVQRAIRSAPHCAFTGEEIVTAFSDMVNWDINGEKPGGNNVLDPEIVSDPDYGCKFTTEKRPRAEACPATP